MKLVIKTIFALISLFIILVITLSFSSLSCGGLCYAEPNVLGVITYILELSGRGILLLLFPFFIYLSWLVSNKFSSKNQLLFAFSGAILMCVGWGILVFLLQYFSGDLRLVHTWLPGR